MGKAQTVCCALDHEVSTFAHYAHGIGFYAIAQYQGVVDAASGSSAHSVACIERKGTVAGSPGHWVDHRAIGKANTIDPDQGSV